MFLVYLAALGSDAAVRRAAERMGEGGDVAGLIFAIAVVAVALPLTWLLRRMRRAP